MSMTMSSRSRLIDFCCKAGGTSKGYHMAGFEVVGVDREHQPNFPFRFHQDDITRISDRQILNIRRNFDACAISPPCQKWSAATLKRNRDGHPDLVEYSRWLMNEIGLPWIMENVVGAPLIDPVQLCGSAFGLPIERHRLFESNVTLSGIACNHQWQERHRPYWRVENGPGSGRWRGIIKVFGTGDGTHLNGMRMVDLNRVAMGIDWMNQHELSQAIPPVYTFYLGKQLWNQI